MRLIERVAEAEVIAEFLRAEIDSPRFGARVRARLAADDRDEAVVREPDLSVDRDNEYRAALLHSYRGIGGSAPLLEGLPEDIEWHRASLERDALDEMHYIDYPYWNELSAGTRSPIAAAARVRAGVTAMNRPNDAFHLLAERLCAGVRLGPPILISPGPSAPAVILEGHTRVTAMALRPECAPDPITLYIGFAPEVRDWMFYGEGEGGS